MSLTSRATMIFKAKANTQLDKMENPTETLDYGVEQSRQLLVKTRRALADVATSRKRVELQAEQLQAQAEKLRTQAQQAMAAGREDLAREALTRRGLAVQQLTDVQAELAKLQQKEEQLTAATQTLQHKIDAMGTHVETLKATYTAAQAQVHINEAVSGISEQMGDVGAAMERAQEKVKAMEARSGAIDELMASGALTDFTGGTTDDLQTQLDAISSDHDIEGQLAAMRQALPSAAPAAITAAPTAPTVQRFDPLA